jgi:signal transduction histidine kinase
MKLVSVLAAEHTAAPAAASAAVDEAAPTVPIPVLRPCAPAVDVDQVSRMVAVADAAPALLHDLASSLQVMGGVEMAAEVVADGPLGVRQAAARAITAWRRADALFGALRRLLRGGDLGRRAIDIERMVAEVVDRAAHGAAVPVRLRSEPATVTVSEPLIGHVLGELVRNAVRATPATGAVDVEIDAAGPLVVVRVIDDGPGAPAHAVAHLDDPRRALDTGAPGVGLVAAALVMQLHGGTLAYRRVQGRGACFSVALPRI